MKKIFFIIGVLLSVNLLSCQDDNSKSASDTLLRTVALDFDYIAFRKVANECAYHVAIKTWSTDDVIGLLNKHGVNSCDIPLSEFEVMKGGKVYREIDCRMVILLDKLNEKFNFSSFSDEQKDKIRTFYKENGGHKEDEELRNKIIQHLNRN